MMPVPNYLQATIAQGRTISTAEANDPALGPFTQLPGTWKNIADLAGHGWNMVALPFMQPGNNVAPVKPGESGPFRLLLNQFDETLIFSTVDKGVPNRGAALAKAFDADQHLAALQYIQDVTQIAAADSPGTNDTPDTPKGKAGIHHEPGLFLHLLSQTGGGPNIARMATIPHGDSVMALGYGVHTQGPPDFENIGDFSPFPVGADPALENNPYFAPYLKFRHAPFKGNVNVPGFPGFDPTNPLALLKGAIPPADVKSTTTLLFDTTLATGGIGNIPFVVKQANSVSMRAIFWIQELKALDAQHQPQFVLQYAQRVMLSFIPIGVGLGAGGDIQWPHISINTMKLTARPNA